MTSEKFESEIKYEQNLKLQTIGAFLHLNKCDQNNIVSKPYLIEPCHLGKIGLNFDIPSPTKFVNFFSFFKNCATNFKEQTISKFKQSILRDVLLHKKTSNRTFENLETPIQLFHLRKNKIFNLE